MPRGGRKPLTATPPQLPKPRKPSANLKAPNKPPMTKPTKPVKPNKPVVKPTKPKPNAPTKPSMIGGIGSGLLTGGALLGGTTLLSGGMPGMGGGMGGLLGLAGQGVQTAGTVAVADKAITAVKDVVEGITKNPMNLAIVAGAIGAVMLLGSKK